MVRFSSLRSLPSFFLFICWLAVRVPVLTGFCSPLLENQAPPRPSPGSGIPRWRRGAARWRHCTARGAPHGPCGQKNPDALNLGTSPGFINLTSTLRGCLPGPSLPLCLVPVCLSPEGFSASSLQRNR